MESKTYTLTLMWDTPKGTRAETIEFSGRPTEEELGAKLAGFFSVDNYRFNEALQQVHECILVTPGGDA
jgi:hypothetical protein